MLRKPSMIWQAMRRRRGNTTCPAIPNWKPTCASSRPARPKPADDCEPNPGSWLFRRWDKKRKRLTGRPLTRLICYRIVKRRAKAIGLDDVTNHTFRATGTTTFLDAGGSLDDVKRINDRR